MGQTRQTGQAAQAVQSFRRFYASFNLLPWSGDREEFKKSIVSQYTDGRTEHLRGMTRMEYDDCCKALETLSGRRDMLRKERSSTLKLMQKLGVNTADWAAVDNFCMDARIAGKRFCLIRLDEHEGLQRKLRAIMRKRKASPAPSKRRGEERGLATVAVMVPVQGGGEA